MRSVTRDLTGGMGHGAPLGYRPGKEHLDYVNGKPASAHDRTKDTQPGRAQRGERGMSGRRHGRLRPGPADAP